VIEENTIRTNDEIVTARPSLTIEERMAKKSEAGKTRVDKKAGKRGTRLRAKKRRKKREPFVRLTLELIKGKAYRELPPSASKMLVHFLSRPGEAFGIPLSDRQAYEVTFNFTYGEASKIGCARATFLTVIEALVRHGFIDPVKRGGVYNGRKVSSVFRLSQRWRAYGTPGFCLRDYRKWAVTASWETIPPVKE